MDKEGLKRMNNKQLLDLRDLESFKEDRQRVIEILLTRNGLEAAAFRDLHESQGCKTESEYIYGKRVKYSGFDVEYDQPVNYFVRKCLVHNVESSKFCYLGEIPDDWNGVRSPSREHLRIYEDG